MPPEFVKGASKSTNSNEVLVRSPLLAPNRKPVAEELERKLRLVYVAPANAVPVVVVTWMALYVLPTAS